jgi:hypothetical protein
MRTDELISHVHARYAQIYLGGIQSTLNKDAAFLSFICMLTAVEALGGFLKPGEKNGPRFKSFILGYFPKAYHAHADALWMLRNAAAHGISPRPYTLTHHNGHLHMTIYDHFPVLNAEDFYAALVVASEKYFTGLKKDCALQASFCCVKIQTQEYWTLTHFGRPRNGTVNKRIEGTYAFGALPFMRNVKSEDTSNRKHATARRIGIGCR